MRAVIAACVACIACVVGPRLGVATAAAAPEVVAVIARGDDVRAALVVGAAGEVYEPGDGGWKRRTAGGVASRVVAAAAAIVPALPAPIVGRAPTPVAGRAPPGAAPSAGEPDLELFAVGAATPLYRRRAGVWQLVRLGQRGPARLSGPTPVVAVERTVFVRAATGWTRVGVLPAAPLALWASGREILAVAGGAVWRSAGVGFARVPGPLGVVAAAPAPIAIGGPGPWLFTATGARALRRGAVIRAITPGEIRSAAATATAVWFLVAPASGPAVLERHPLTATRPPTPPEIAPTPLAGDAALAGMLADTGGRVLVVTAAGATHLRVDGAWSAATVADDLPPPHPGPGPAHTR